MAVSPTFFNQLDVRLDASRRERVRTATYLYNHSAEPAKPLREEKSYWFEPWERHNFTGFKRYSDFSDDAASLIMKPYVFSALAVYEAQKFFLCFPAAVVQVVKLSPTGLANKLFDMLEAVVVGVACVAMATIEFYLQAASLAVRLAITGLNFIGLEPPLPKNSDMTDAEHILAP
ncbi:MAG: hypothetical protein P1U32_00805 [Legionellaceae bacterium]|nr:hypothetical protein [Legionellaceae bacterium]